MKLIIGADEEKCRGCATCASVCPVGEANIISVVNDKLRIRVDSQKCIACGACLRACPDNARYYNDDTGRFFNDLKKGEQIALIVAPAFIANFTNWKAILAWLKTQGMTVIVDVQLGIKICTWAHLRYIERNNKAALITQPCPPIVSYIEKYRPELLKRLSPVYSPILCMSVYMKKILKFTDKIAALTPCPAKANEFEKAHTIEYNVTFTRLADYLTAHSITIPQADFDLDNIHAIPGRGDIMPNSRQENIKRTIGCLRFTDSQIKVEIIENCGNLYRYLDYFSRCEEDSPTLLDALNCIGGCCCGVGGSTEKFDDIHITHKRVEGKMDNDSGQAHLFSVLDSNLALSDFLNSI